MEHYYPGTHPLNNAAEVHALATCKRCGDDKLGWKKSSRTGKWYLADVQACDLWRTREDPNFRYFILARRPHKCAKRSFCADGN
ncbi:hypothetical protein ACFRSX_32895 [Streptomyces goshikiensis]|uniref:hypothetical protein n=1 Tax=Streptomyces TaxID=1883 RepID=UPI000C27378B|nr:hypothetical protein [Streptomyces sp. CB02120-2]PJN14576.1 hypothetical protein CG724_33345 [Streptomyces sp. CB02120-2]